MASQTDVRRLAMALPGTVAATDRFAFSLEVKGRPVGYAWVWLERTDPRKARIPNPKVLALRVSSLTEKDLMLANDPERFFTEPHYNGYPAVLLRLERVTVAELRVLLTDAHGVVAKTKAKAKAKTKAKTRAKTKAGQEPGR